MQAKIPRAALVFYAASEEFASIIAHSVCMNAHWTLISHLSLNRHLTDVKSGDKVISCRAR